MPLGAILIGALAGLSLSVLAMLGELGWGWALLAYPVGGASGALLAALVLGGRSARRGGDRPAERPAPPAGRPGARS